jgi:hypothetical protein
MPIINYSLHPSFPKQVCVREILLTILTSTVEVTEIFYKNMISMLSEGAYKYEIEGQYHKR